MHAVRGTIGYDPVATARAEGRDLYPTSTKQESRERFFAERAEAFKDAKARETAGAIERNAERYADQRRVDGQRVPLESRPTLAPYEKAKAHLDQAVAELASPLSTADFPAYGISD